MMLTYISQLEAMANNAAENAAEQMKTPTLEDGKGKRLKKTAETFENMFPSDVREPEEADGNVSDPEEAQLGPRQLSCPTEEAQLGPRQRNGNHRPEALEEAQPIMFTHISQLEAMDSHFPQPPLPPPLTEAEAMPAPPRPEQLSDMDAGGEPQGEPSGAHGADTVRALVANAFPHVRGPDRNGYIRCDLPPWNEFRVLGRITAWQRGVRCRCYAHANCSLARPRAAFSDRQYTEWLLSGVLGDKLLADGLGELDWRELSVAQREARRRRHLEMAAPWGLQCRFSSG